LEWRKVILLTTGSNTELISAILYDFGIYSIEIDDPNERRVFLSDPSANWDYVDDLLTTHPSDTSNDVLVTFYLGTDIDSQNLLELFKAELINQSLVSESQALTSEMVTDQSWLHEWKKYFHPIRIGRVIIVPAWDEPILENISDIACIIDPGSAFGTGQHITTSLCIEALQDRLSPEDLVIDIGCGSGILSITSLLLEAKNVISTDIELYAIEATKKNAKINSINLDSLHVFAGNILTSTALLETIIKRGNYNIIVANIVADVLIDLAPIVSNMLMDNGCFIASGIITERLEAVLSSFTNAGFTILESKTVEGWCSVVAAHG